MKLKFFGILTLGTLCSVALLNGAFAQDRDYGIKRAGHHEGAGLQHPGAGPGMMRAHGKRGGNHRGDAQNLDADGDGMISLSEFLDRRLSRLDEHFSRMDQDGDGLISLEEREPPVRPDHPNRPARPEIDRAAVAACVRETIADYTPELDEGMDARFELADTDGDGFLSLAEVSAAMQTRATTIFNRIDTDADGLLSDTELAAHHAAQLNIRRLVRACIRAQLKPDA